MTKINKYLFVFTGLLIVISLAMILMIKKFSPLLSSSAYYCSANDSSQFIQIPDMISKLPFIAVGSFFLLIAIKLLISLIGVMRQRFQLEKFITRDSRFTQITRKTGLENTAFLIKSRKKFAYSLGIISPRVYISTGLFSTLSTRELEAVLRHEEYHVKNHDTGILILASIVQSLLPFFPIVKDVILQYRIRREIAADQFAIKSTGQSKTLISVLKKLLHSPTHAIVYAPSIGSEETLEPRIFALTNRKYSAQKWGLYRIVFSIVSCIVLAIVVAAPIQASHITGDTQNIVMLCTNGRECMNTCTTENSITKLYSEMENASQPYSGVR